MFRGQNRERGVTLVELLLTTSIMGVLAASIVVQIRSGRQVWMGMGSAANKAAEAVQNARIAMDKMTRELRQCQDITDVSNSDDTEGYIEFQDRDDYAMKFQYNNGYLEYGLQSEPDLQILAGPIDNLTFTCYKDDGITQTTIPGEIRSILIQLAAYEYDSEGTITPVNLSSRVFLRRDPTYLITDFAMFSGSGLYLRNNAIVTGDVGSHNVIELRNNAILNGDVAVGSTDDVIIHNNAVINGSTYTNRFVTIPAASSFSVGVQDVTLNNNIVADLEPGQYGDLLLKNNSRLTLYSGDYYFGSIAVKNNVTLDIPGNGNIRIFVSGDVEILENLQIAIDGAVVNISSELAREKAERVFIETHGSWEMGNGSKWIGAIFAPNGNIELTSGTGYVTGALYSSGTIEIHNNSVLYFVRPSDDVLPTQFQQ